MEAKRCVLEDKLCTNCGDCDRCDLDPNKRCDNCEKCLNIPNAEYLEIKIDEVMTASEAGEGE